jgi:hypothetical protein
MIHLQKTGHNQKSSRKVGEKTLSAGVPGADRCHADNRSSSFTPFIPSRRNHDHRSPQHRINQLVQHIRTNDRPPFSMYIRVYDTINKAKRYNPTTAAAAKPKAITSLITQQDPGMNTHKAPIE